MFPLLYIIFYCTLLLLFALFCATVCINYNQNFMIFQFYLLISHRFLFFPQFIILVFVHFSSFIFVVLKYRTIYYLYFCYYCSTFPSFHSRVFCITHAISYAMHLTFLFSFFKILFISKNERLYL